jgi:ketosteroid isomerase-like protein
MRRLPLLRPRRECGRPARELPSRGGQGDPSRRAIVTAFSNMHRELYRIYVDGNVVVVQLALQGTHDGPLQLPFGELPATGKQMDAPCCDVFELEDGKIKRFDCYPEGSIIFAQLGVLNNLDAALGP